MSSTTRTEGGALRMNFSKAACSAGRSLSERMSPLPLPETLAWPERPFSERASSMRPLYSAAAGVKLLSDFLLAAGTAETGSGFLSADTGGGVTFEASGLDPDGVSSAGEDESSEGAAAAALCVWD